MEHSESEIPARVELGVGSGGFCKAMVEENRGPVWAYDTFDGKFPLDTAGEGENRDVYEWGGQFSTPAAKAELESIGVVCVEGVFPDSFHAKSPASVSFVHVDMDTYKSTKAALGLFHPLMVPHGEFWIHDYDNSSMPGVRWAVDDFAQTEAGKQYDHNPSAPIQYQACYHMRKRP